MPKKLIFTLLITLLISGCVMQSSDNTNNKISPAPKNIDKDAATKKNTSSMTAAEAKAIAEKSCIKGGEALNDGYYNENSKTWWFDANLNATKPGCNPACVVSEETKTAEINWRCTGLIQNPDDQAKDTTQTITNFDECIKAGNPVMESYPRKCAAQGKTFTEIIKQQLLCTEESRKADFCTEDYNPVCAEVQVQCIKAPCPPIKETFSNICSACRNSLVLSYTKGECQDTPTDKTPILSQLFKDKYPKYAQTISLSFTQEDDNHVRGQVSFAPGEAGGIFLAAKISDAWKIVFDGNGQIPCNLSQYDFPPDMLSDCSD